MKKLLILLLLCAFTVSFNNTIAQTKKTVKVKSYAKKNGTRVKAHSRKPKSSKKRRSDIIKHINSRNLVFINDRKQLKLS